MGRIYQLPTLRYTREAVPILEVTVTISRVARDLEDGLKHEEIVFVPVILRGPRAEIGLRLKKGQAVFVEGRLGNWEDTLGVVAESLQIGNRVTRRGFAQASRPGAVVASQLDLEVPF